MTEFMPHFAGIAIAITACLIAVAGSGLNAPAAAAMSRAGRRGPVIALHLRRN